MLSHLSSAPVSPERVVVIGSRGFVGGSLVDNLKKLQIPYLAISSKNVDLLKPESVELLKSKINANDSIVFVSAKAPCKTPELLEQNITMAKHFCQAIEDKKLNHLVYISSDAVYADNEFLITENISPSPNSLHGAMHLARELMLQGAVKGKFPLAILRPSVLYGENDPHNGYGPNKFRRLALNGEDITLFGNGEEKRDHVHIDDVAQLITLVLQHKSAGILNIATGTAISFHDIAKTIIKSSGKDIKIIPTERKNSITHRNFDVTNINKSFSGYKFRMEYNV